MGKSPTHQNGISQNGFDHHSQLLWGILGAGPGASARSPPCARSPAGSPGPGRNEGLPQARGNTGPRWLLPGCCGRKEGLREKWVVSSSN